MNLEELNEFIKQHKKIVISIRPKNGCEICEVYGPVFKKVFDRLTKKYSNLFVCVVPIDEELINKLSIFSPTILFYNNKKEIDRIIVEKIPLKNFTKTLENKTEKIMTIL